MFSNGFAPPGLQKVAESPDDFGFSHMTTYTAPSGSVVFATGSMQWSWGLDDYNVPNPRVSVLDPRVQTTTRNILARFAVAAPPQLLPPAGLLASGQLGKVVLSWSPATNAVTYNIYRATTSGGEGATPYRTGIGAVSFADTSPVAAVVNYYQVTTVNGSTESAKSNEAGAMPLAANTAPAAPTNVAAAPVGANIKLTWTQSTSAGVSSNKVYRATTSGGPFALIATLGATTSYTDNRLNKKTTYYYQTTAIGSGGLESTRSATATATSK
jgi:fibronectin type 3 domain-containing protein